LFSIEYRNQVREHTLRLAQADARVVSGAIVGSLAFSDGDRWSDLDLTFGVSDDCSIHRVLEDWTIEIVNEFDATHLFDLPSGAAIYRVFLLPGCLQFDLSFAPASSFGALGPQFRLLFGKSVNMPVPPSPSAQGLFGYAIHHVLRARFCIERGRFWQAEYWISAARDYALHLACLRRGLPAYYGRGFDELPAEIHAAFEHSFVSALRRKQLLRALGCVIDGLLDETDGMEELAQRVKPQLLSLATEWTD